MKGTYFQKPLEFRIVTEGQSWRQGESIKGTLSIKDHSGNQAPQGTVKLAFGLTKKIKEKAADAFQVFKEAEVNSDGAWELSLDGLCPVTDKTGSPYLLYGSSDSDQLGNLQVDVQPSHFVTEFIEVFESTHSFAVKYRKNKKDWVEYKLVAPEGNTYVKVDNALLLFQFEQDKLKVRYTFNVKGLDAQLGSMKVVKGKKLFEQTFSPDEYRLFNDHLNKSLIEKQTTEILESL